ncbi:MAG: TRAP transporter substrate-binding protein [Proteobacteria bacterium]|nr:TRAP transporter substrate-binding protein [Pseudomonadota bacterium]
MTSFKLLALAAGALVLGLAGEARAQTKWIMATGYPESNFMTKNVRQFIDEVQKASGGKFEIALSSNDTLIKLDSIKRAVQTGQIPIGEIRFGVYGNEDPMYILDGTPFLAADYAAAWKLLEAQKPYFDTLFKKNGMRIVGYQPWPGQGFYTKFPVAKMDDFKGKRLRIYSTSTKKMGDMMGFNATILPFAEVPQAFSTGLIEALFTSPQTGIDIQAWENTKYFTNAGALFSKNGLIVNERAFQKLSPEVRAAMTKAGEAFTKRGWEMSAAVSAEQIETLRKNGMTTAELPDAIKQQMKEIGETMISDWKSEANAEAIAVLNYYLSKQQASLR